MPKSREYKFKDLDAGDWFMYQGELCIKDSLTCAVRFRDGGVRYISDDSTVEFIKSVELIYD